MNRTDNFLIDPRGAADFRRQLAALAKSYTPEWAFNPETPDIGAAIALIFAAQLEETAGQVNQALEHYHEEFVNLLQLSPLPAFPASGVVVMQPIADTVLGVDVPRGTKLLGETVETNDSIVFETQRDVHVTSSHLCDVLSVSGYFGKILPLLGDWQRPSLVPDSAPHSGAAGGALPAFSLFDYTGEGIARNALLLGHKNAFDTAAGVEICVYAEEKRTAAPLALMLADPARFRWSYYTQNGLAPFDEVRTDGTCIFLRKTRENKRFKLKNEEYSLICAEALTPMQAGMEVGRLEVSSCCGETPPECVLHNDELLDAAEFLPFGPTASVFDECYLGHNRIFSQQNAAVTLSFFLSYQKKLVTMTPEQERDDLKVIKRKPRQAPQQTAETAVQRVSFEYFNGLGWRRLECGDWSSVFSGQAGGKMEITFCCPPDWQPTVVGGFETRAIRMRVLQADNCYLQPCMHTMPLLARPALSYRYERGVPPQLVRRICGTVPVEEPLHSGSAIFSPLPYPQNALLLGFDHHFSGAPIRLFFDVEEAVSLEGVPISFEYSTFAGFQPLKVIDHTRGFSSAGTVVFFPPADFSARVVEGKSRYWLRITDTENQFCQPKRYHPVICGIQLNAVEVCNLETRPEESFYIDASAPNMAFPLAEKNIHSVEVFVNERTSLSPAAMRRLLAEHPEDVRCETDFLGEQSGFFVRWAEVESFDTSHSGDRHYRLDRATSTLLFGDGLSVRIPAAQTDAAFTVRATCCAGARGNLSVGAVNAPLGRLLYIDRIFNPVATCAGSNAESPEAVRRRGANQISSKNRLVSELDFTRAVRAFSSSIDKVKCVIERGADCRRGRPSICIAVMTRDYKDGAYSFQNIKSRLTANLLERCEVTVGEASLQIFEPVYIEISVDVWVTAATADLAFDLQAALLARINGFIEPLSGGGRAGWELGTLPSEAQLGMLLQSVSAQAVIERFAATTRCTDQTGTHWGGLTAQAGNPFRIGVNGNHRVHLSFAKGGQPC